MTLQINISTPNLVGIRTAIQNKANKLAQIAETSPIEAARAGRQFAMSIAPRKTGALWRAIDVGTTGKGRAIVRVDSTRLQPNKYGMMFNYASYMHLTNGMMGNQQRIRTGDPRFMYTTREWLNKKFPEDVKRKIRLMLGARDSSGFVPTSKLF